MARAYVVADTNFYRSCSDGDMEAIASLETRADVVPLATYLACSELLPHAADEASPASRSCRAAIRRLYHHCFARHRATGAPPFAPDTTALLALDLFGRPIPDQSILTGKFAGMVADIGHGDAPDSVPGLRAVLDLVTRQRNLAESRFVAMLEGVVRQLGLNPDARSEFPEDQRPSPQQFAQEDTLRRLCAGAIALSVANDCGLEISDAEIFTRGEALQTRIPTAIDFLAQVIRTVVIDRASTVRHANSLWDTHFATFASQALRFEGTPILLVTDDRAVLRAAARTHAEARVLTQRAYTSFLQAVA